MIIDTSEAARRLGVGRCRVIQLIREGRVQGAVKVGRGDRGVWAIEVDGDAEPVILPSPQRNRRRPADGRER